MVNLVAAGAALFSFTSLILVAISMATNFWVRFEDPRVPGTTTVNPFVTNTGFAPLELNYDLDYFGLWVGCHRETAFDKISCGYIGASCYSNICWIRNGEDEQCKNARVEPIDNCAAYQATRAMVIIGTIFLILGASLQVVSICVASRTITTGGALSMFLAAFFLMIGFAVFHRNVFINGDLNDFGNIGWSFVLLIVAWPLALLGSVLGFLASLSTPKQDPEYDETE